MLLDSLYHIEQSSGDGKKFNALVLFNPAHPLFKGHFPNLPVVPGVCQIQMVTEITGVLLGRSLRLISASHVKFLELLKPAMAGGLNVEIDVEEQENAEWLVQSHFFGQGKTYLKFKGLMR